MIEIPCFITSFGSIKEHGAIEVEAIVPNNKFGCNSRGFEWGQKYETHRLDILISLFRSN